MGEVIVTFWDSVAVFLFARLIELFFLNTTHNTRDMATLSLPEKTSKDLLLVYKYTKAEGIAKLQTAENLALEVTRLHVTYAMNDIWLKKTYILKVGGDKYDGPVTIAKYLASKTQPELLGDGKDNQAEVNKKDKWGVRDSR